MAMLPSNSVSSMSKDQANDTHSTISEQLRLAPEGSGADSSLSHRVARLDNIIEQLIHGDLPAMRDFQHVLKERMDIMEVRTEALVEQRLDKAAGTIAEKAAEALEKLGIDGHKVISETPEVTTGERYARLHANEVQALVDDALRAARAEWKAEADLHEKRADSVEELGSTLIKEFERSIVDIVEKAVAEARTEARLVSCHVLSKDQLENNQAERMEIAELKLNKLFAEVENLKVSNAGDISPSRNYEDNSLQEALAATVFHYHKDAGQEDNLNQEVSDNGARSGNAALWADVAAIRTEIRRLVSVDLHAIIQNVQRLQLQSDTARMQVADALEKSMAAVKSEAEARKVEDRRLEQLCKDRTAYGQAPGIEMSSFGKKMHQILTDVVENRSEEVEGQAVSRKYNSIMDSTVSSMGKLSTSSDGSIKTRLKHVAGEDPSQMVEDLRETILTYFRSEFQDHVADTLSKLQPDSSPKLTARQAANASQFASWLSPMSPNSARYSATASSRSGSPRMSSAPSIVCEARPTRDLSAGGSVSLSRGGSISIPGGGSVSLPAVTHVAPGVLQAMALGRTGEMAVPHSGSMTLQQPLGGSGVAPVRGPSAEIGVPSTERTHPADIALAGFESKLALFEAKSSPQKVKRSMSPVIQTSMAPPSVAYPMRRSPPPAASPKSVCRQVSGSPPTRTSLPANFTLHTGKNALYPMSLPNASNAVSQMVRETTNV